MHGPLAPRMHSPWSSLSINRNNFVQGEDQSSKRIGLLLRRIASEIQRSWQASLQLGLVPRAMVVVYSGAIHQSAQNVDRPATCRLCS